MEKPLSNISIFQKGDNTSSPIIFVHGFPYDHHMWDKVIDPLSKEYFCISYDIRGLGSSDPGDGQFTMEMFVDDLFSVIESSGIEKPVLCGLSMGGYISLRAIERNEKKFKALILCDTKPEADNNEGKLKRAQAINIINTKGLNAFVKDFVPTCFAEESIKQLGMEYEKVLERSYNSNPLGVKGCLLAMAGRTDTTEYLSKIRLPALIISGEKDKLTPPDLMRGMSSKIKNSEFVLIPGSGHMTPIENPELVTNSIRNFLQNLPG
jgi:3-oxoadipate enol-lactonase